MLRILGGFQSPFTGIYRGIPAYSRGTAVGLVQAGWALKTLDRGAFRWHFQAERPINRQKSSIWGGFRQFLAFLSLKRPQLAAPAQIQAKLFRIKRNTEY